ncbi:carboxypeptidase M32 [Roseospira marina]|uniref:Metal-dependent carboxypeptidase n=1 Tax=Roseospira marina TaxID=140057 RepID=A0A5M6I9R8_9PROT|nr:carboxypeptidase M32 [Roseospira marina]KAA5604980.1 carboxypeptidase M32 [Roseospira marina]MBB4315016.1 carboxypeptidase Taq [Roseospira marina]MBB5088016.1 carboxypeptidase Taq [Roseospira marina]
MDAPTAYARLKTRFARLTHLEDAAGMLHWDLSTVMPEGGADARAAQLATLRAVSHDLLTAPEVGALLDGAERDEATALDPWDRANLDAMRRQWRHATVLSADLVEAHSRACSACEMAWRGARAGDDFAAVRDKLATVLSLTREIAAAKAEALGRSPYDALLDQYEPDGREAEIEAVFDDLAADLPGLLDDALAAQGREPALVRPAGPFPVERQRALVRHLMERIGFDFRHGRLDESLHPFCGGVPDDVRITTRYDEADFSGALMGVLHETGHALYERGLPAAWRDQPVGRALGMSVHESQSLLMEMQACRSRAFLTFAAPVMADKLGAAPDAPGWDADSLYRLNTRVEPGLIRVDADEVTYPAHVILRFRLERALLSGDLALDDLPGAWRDGMRDLLGVAVPDDRTGCLQDIHWYDGAIGYFPTYTLGAMTAAQLFQAAVTAVPDVPEALARGDFAPLLGWLRTHVHGLGQSVTAREMLTRATGRPLDAAVFKAHLRRRYVDRAG